MYVFYAFLVGWLIVTVWLLFKQQTAVARQISRQIWRELVPPVKKQERLNKRLTSLQRSLMQDNEITSSKLIGSQVNFKGRVIDVSDTGEVKIDLEVNTGEVLFFSFLGNTYAKFSLSISDAQNLNLNRRYSFVGQLADFKIDNDNVNIPLVDAYAWVIIEFDDVVLA